MEITKEKMIEAFRKMLSEIKNIKSENYETYEEIKFDGFGIINGKENKCYSISYKSLSNKITKEEYEQLKNEVEDRKIFIRKEDDEIRYKQHCEELRNILLKVN